MDKLRLVHLGPGAWGGNWAVHVLPGHPDADVVAYVDGDAGKRLAFAERLGEPPGKFFATLEEAVALSAVADTAHTSPPTGTLTCWPAFGVGIATMP